MQRTPAIILILHEMHNYGVKMANLESSRTNEYLEQANMQIQYLIT